MAKTARQQDESRGHHCPMCGEPWNEDVCGVCGWFEGKQPRWSEGRTRAIRRAILRTAKEAK